MFRPASDAAPIVMPAGTRATPAAGDLQVPAFVAPLALHASAYQRIAVALELGAADESVLGFLHGLEMAQGAELVLVHVAESAASRYLGAESHDAETIEDERALENIAAELRLRGVACRVALGHGDVKREIARLVRESGADLLVTGSHGHTGIRDVVYGLDCVLQNGAMNGEAYNLASGIETRIKDAVELFAETLGSTRQYKFNGLVRPGDPLNWKADNSKIKQLGFQSVTTFSAGLKELTEWIIKT